MTSAIKRAHFNAVWAHTSETPEWIAARGDAVRRVLADLLDIEEWTVDGEEPWEGDSQHLVELVQARPSSAAMGVPDPEGGYTIGLHGGRDTPVTVAVAIFAGRDVVGRRHPAHSAYVEVFAAPETPLPDGYEQAIIAALAEHFDALMVNQANRDVFRANDRGG